VWVESKVVDGKVQTDLRDLDELHELADDLVRLTGLITMINIVQQGDAKTQRHAFKPDFNEATSRV
jgi:hypothetical protein